MEAWEQGYEPSLPLQLSSKLPTPCSQCKSPSNSNPFTNSESYPSLVPRLLAHREPGYKANRILTLLRSAVCGSTLNCHECSLSSLVLTNCTFSVWVYMAPTIWYVACRPLKVSWVRPHWRVWEICPKWVRLFQNRTKILFDRCSQSLSSLSAGFIVAGFIVVAKACLLCLPRWQTCLSLWFPGRDYAFNKWLVGFVGL